MAYSFTTHASEPMREKVRVIPVDQIDVFPDHPFRVNDDEDMEKLRTSISEIGIQTPIVARPKEDGRFEIISGHRRLFACKKLGIAMIPAIVRTMTRDEAIIAMVDSNLQREFILPSEKAAAYKMKMEALKRQGQRNDLTSSPLETKFRSDEMIAEESGDSRAQVQRYIRLNELVPEILEKVDQGSIAFRPAVELSYLSEDEQHDLVETMESEEATPSLAQAIRMKQLSRDGKLDTDTIFGIMTEEKPNQVETIKFKMNELEPFFPERTPAEIMKKQILKILSVWKKREQAKETDRTKTVEPLSSNEAPRSKKRGGSER